MANTNDEVISVLNDLIETCKDGIKGFETAAKEVKAPRAKSLFESRAATIQNASSELQAEVRRLGGDPDKSGSVAGALHRGWMDVKGAVTGHDDNAIIAECERGEDAAVKSYEDALQKNLPPDVRRIVEQQYRGAISNRDAVRALKHSESSASYADNRSADTGTSPQF